MPLPLSSVCGGRRTVVRLPDTPDYSTRVALSRAVPQVVTAARNERPVKSWFGELSAGRPSNEDPHRRTPCCSRLAMRGAPAKPIELARYLDLTTTDAMPEPGRTRGTIRLLRAEPRRRAPPWRNSGRREWWRAGRRANDRIVGDLHFWLTCRRSEISCQRGGCFAAARLVTHQLVTARPPEAPHAVREATRNRQEPS
jgi:hypothetical protein